MAIDIEALTGLLGEEIGVGEWYQITQDRIDAFADASEDHQWIHQAGAQADAGPFGGPIAHGFLTLSLLGRLTRGIATPLGGARMVVNYGLDKVRFITPVPVGSRIRARVTLAELTPIEAGLQVKQAVTIELDGAERPAAYIESLTRLYH